MSLNPCYNPISIVERERRKGSTSEHTPLLKHIEEEAEGSIPINGTGQHNYGATGEAFTESPKNS